MSYSLGRLETELGGEARFYRVIIAEWLASVPDRPVMHVALVGVAGARHADHVLGARQVGQVVVPLPGSAPLPLQCLQASSRGA